MDGAATKPSPAAANDDWRGVAIMSLAWASTMSTMTATIVSANVAGSAFSPSVALETLPLGCVFYFSGAGQALLPWGFRRIGRRSTYLLSSVLGCLGGTVLAIGCWRESFFAICTGCCLQGVATAAGTNYRFGAMLLAPSAKEKAAGWVLFGGVLGAVGGSAGLTRFNGLFDAEYAGVFAMSALMHIITFGLLACVRMPAAAVPGPGAPQDSVGAGAAAPRSVWRVLLQPLCITAVVAVSMSYAAMMLPMSTTPLVMLEKAGHTFDDASYVMLIHATLMFAPSPLTARAIVRFEPVPVMLVACFLFGACSVTLVAGTPLPYFYIGLAILGVAWNMLYLAGTAQVGRVCTQAEAAKTQSVVDAVAAVASGTSSLLSGLCVDAFSWTGTNFLGLGLAAGTAVAVATLWVLSRLQPQPELQGSTGSTRC